MELKAGHIYDLMNLMVPQGTPGAHPKFKLNDTYEYRGELIVRGEKLAHQNHPYRVGFTDVPASEAVFVVLRDTGAANVARMVDFLKGLPLALRRGDDLLYIVNWATRLGALWYTPWGEKPNTDELLKRARKAIDIYRYVRTNGKFEVHVRAARNVEIN